MSLLVAPIVTTPLLKVPLLLSSGYLSYVAHIPPQGFRAPPDEGNKRDLTDFGTRYMAPIAVASVSTSVALFGLAIAEAAVDLAQSYPSAKLSKVILSLLVPASARRPVPLYFSPRRLFGISLVVFGGLIRTFAYRTLGRLFIAEVTVQRGHKLVTSGPYAYVRHPSYTGWAALALGNAIALTAPGSYIAGIHSTFGSVVSYAMIGSWAAASLFLPKRAKREDELMRKEFEQEWTEWAKKTPYKLIPYVW